VDFIYREILKCKKCMYVPWKSCGIPLFVLYDFLNLKDVACICTLFL